MGEQPVDCRGERSGTEPERSQVWASSGEAAQFPPGDDEQGNDKQGDDKQGDDKRRAEGESRSGD